MAFNVRQMPADRAAALIGEDDVAVFSQRLETMAATSQFDLEEPDSTRLTFLFEVGKDDLLREGKWLDGVDYMSDLVFETPRDLAGKVFKRFETFADDDHTPSEALADVQHKIETQYRPLVDALAAERDMLADDQIPFSEADLVRQQTLGSKDSFLTVGGTHIADREEAIRALRRAQRRRARCPGRHRRGRAMLGGRIRARWARRGREAQGRHVSRGAFRVYAMKDTSDRGPVSGPLSP